MNVVNNYLIVMQIKKGNLVANENESGKFCFKFRT